MEKRYAARGAAAHQSAVIGLLVLLLVSCTQMEYQPPPPTPRVVELDHSPAVRTWQPAFYACAATLPGIALFTREAPASRLDVAAADLILRLDVPRQPGSFYSAQVGEEQIIVIFHPDNPMKDIDEQALRQLYTGQVEQWDVISAGFSQPVQVWTYPEGDDIRQSFEAALFAAAPPQVQGFLVPDPQAMLEAVNAEPGAWGYIPKSWLARGEVSEITLTADLSSRLLQPVLAVAAGEPQEPVRSLLSCMQNAQK